jgi:hypothetical protein
MAGARSRSSGAVAALACAATLAAGCGLGAGPSTEGEASLAVTRDYGTQVLVEATLDDPPESETVIRMLDSESDVTTRYGGGFVQSIEGLAGGVEDGRSFDWFFYVNGVESEVGAAEAGVRAGDRVWWDHRDWTAAMRVPAVVGSWPEPFAQASAGDAALPVEVGCAGNRAPCEVARDALAAEDVEARVVDAGSASADAPRMLVGPWRQIANDPAARLVAQGPALSGVFAAVDAGGNLTALDVDGDPVRPLGPATGLIAATRDGEAPPTWLVTGAGPAGVEAAADALGEGLEHRYAVLVEEGEDAIPLPVAGSGG